METRSLAEKIRRIAGLGLPEADIGHIAGYDGMSGDVSVHATGDPHAFARQAVVGRRASRRFGESWKTVITEGVSLVNRNIEFGRETADFYEDRGIKFYGGEKRTANFNMLKPYAVLITSREENRAGDAAGPGRAVTGRAGGAKPPRRDLYIYIPPVPESGPGCKIPESRPGAAASDSRRGEAPGQPGIGRESAALLADSPPLVVTEDGAVISRLRIKKPDGFAIVIKASRVTVRECDISGSINICGPVSDITIQNNYIHDQRAEGGADYVKQFAGVTTTEGSRWGNPIPQPVGARDIKIIGNFFRNCQSGAYLVDCKGPLVFRGNYSENHRGPFPRGAMVQITYCDGSEGQIRVERNFAYVDPNSPDQNNREETSGGVEDHINGFCSTGSEKFPILIADNYISGHSSSTCGSGIMLGDGGGGYYHVLRNRVYNAGNAGIGAGSGRHWLIEGNRIFQNPAACQYNGKGLQIDNYGDPYGRPITVRGNKVCWACGKGDGSILCMIPDLVDFSDNSFGDPEAFGPPDPMPLREPPEPVGGLLRPWE